MGLNNGKGENNSQNSEFIFIFCQAVRGKLQGVTEKCRAGKLKLHSSEAGQLGGTMSQRHGAVLHITSQ